MSPAAVDVLGQVLDLLVVRVGAVGVEVADREHAEEAPVPGDREVADAVLRQDRLDLVELALGTDDEHFGRHDLADERRGGVAPLGHDAPEDVALGEDSPESRSVGDDERADAVVVHQTGRVHHGGARRHRDDPDGLLLREEVPCGRHGVFYTPEAAGVNVAAERKPLGILPAVPDAALWVLVLLLVLAGIAGAILPAIPGAPLVFGGLLLGAFIDGFEKVGWLPLVVIGFLTALSFVVDLAATALGAKKAGASPLALVGAAVGTVVGLFFGFVGVLLGPFVGAALGEYVARRDLRQAGRAGFGTWLGILLGSAAKIALMAAMVGVFAVAWLV